MKILSIRYREALTLELNHEVTKVHKDQPSVSLCEPDSYRVCVAVVQNLN